MQAMDMARVISPGRASFHLIRIVTTEGIFPSGATREQPHSWNILMAINAKLVTRQGPIEDVTLELDDPRDIDLIEALGGGGLVTLGRIGPWEVLATTWANNAPALVIGVPPDISDAEPRRQTCDLNNVQVTGLLQAVRAGLAIFRLPSR